MFPELANSVYSSIPLGYYDVTVLKEKKLKYFQNNRYEVYEILGIKMVFFIPGTDSKIFQGARRVFTFHIEIFSLLSELANSVMKRSKCEKWKLFKPLEKFKRKGLGWVKCFLRLIEVYLYAIINYFNLPRKVDTIMQNFYIGCLQT